MKVIYGVGRLKKFRPVTAIGIFDGFHLGHRKLIKNTVRRAKILKAKSLVLTFWPHPQNVVGPQKGTPHLISLQHRLDFFKALAVDYCLVINFTKRFSKITAQDFIQELLIKKIRPREIFVGKNFRFGKGAKGDIKLLKENSLKFNYKLNVLADIKINKKIVSSSLIRNLIQQGRLKEAAKFLGRRVCVLGTVIKGQTLGRHLGIPTANINAHHEVIPPAGVYIVKVILKKEEFWGLCYIGTRPTFKNKFKNKNLPLHIEVHIFNFKKVIYGKDLKIEFMKRIRGQFKFASPQQLIQRIKKDIRFAKSLLKRL